MRRWSILLVLGALLASGCRDVTCTSEILPGVILRITEEGGPFAEPIAVRYRVNGAGWMDIADTSAGCAQRTRCELGPELDGRYEIEITRGPVHASTYVDVTADACHVHTVEVPVTLPAA